MKSKALLTTIFLASFLTGCELPDGDFWGDSAVVVCKTQTNADKEKCQARYTVSFKSKKYSTKILIFSENFANPGDTIRGSTNGFLVVEAKN